MRALQHGDEGAVKVLDSQRTTALQQAIADLTGVSMVTRYVVVAEVVNEDGSLGLADVTSPGMPYWDFTGMLTAALQGREAQPMWAHDPDGDDD